jgi:hypothetical protein
VIEVPLPYSYCNNIKTVKKSPFIETIYFNLGKISEFGGCWQGYRYNGKRLKGH